MRTTGRAARYMQEDTNHPKAKKAHMMRWGALRFGALDVDSRLESWGQDAA